MRQRTPDICRLDQSQAERAAFYVSGSPKTSDQLMMFFLHDLNPHHSSTPCKDPCHFPTQITVDPPPRFTTQPSVFFNKRSPQASLSRQESRAKAAPVGNSRTSQVPADIRTTATSGFSLIELMIAMFLFAIVSLGVYPLMWTNMQTNAKNGLRTTAETVAVRWMDSLIAQGYNGLANVAESSDPINNNFTCQVAVTTNAADDRKDILLTIRWSLGNNNYSYRVETIKVRNNG